MHGNKNGGYIYRGRIFAKYTHIYPFLTRIGKYLLHLCGRKEGDRSLCNIFLTVNLDRLDETIG